MSGERASPQPAELGAEHERHRMLFEHAPFGVVFHDSAGRVVEANQAAQRMLGLTLEQIQGSAPRDPRWEVINADGSVAPKPTRPAATAFDRAEPVGPMTLGVRDPQRDGTRWLDVSATPCFRPGESKPFAVFTILEEVTEARSREAERLLLERRMRVHYEVGHVGLSVTSPGKGWIAVNDRLCEILGYSRDELLSLTWAEMTHPDDLSADVAQFERVVAGEIDGYRLDKRFLRKDGSVVWIDLSVRCLRGPGGELDEFVALLDDITPRKLQEERLLHSQKLEGLGRLAGGVAHDFNNLLSAVLVNAELALDTLAPDDPVRADLEEIRGAGQRAAELTKQLLAFGRKQILAPKTIDLSAVVGGIEPMLRTLLGEDVTLRLHLEEGLPLVFADPGQLELVLVNLVVNARDAMPQGGTVSLETRRGGLGVVLTVRDTGHGMDAATLAHVFEPFFTTKEKGRGTGLGLATVYGIVQQSGGEVTVQSEAGVGATFEVTLPVAPVGTSARPEASEARPQLGGTETILLVEDEPSVRRIAERVLTSGGYTVLVCGSGTEALERARAHAGAIDLLLTDVVMPVLGGPELAERVAAVRPGIRVLFMSGFADGQFRSHALAADTQFIPKPFGTTELAKKVRAVLDG